MLKRYFILISVVLSSCLQWAKINAQAPPFVTAVSNSFGGSLQEEFFGGSACRDGGYLLTGLTNSIDGDISMSTPLDTANIFIVKCDAQGNNQWALTMGGNDYDKARFGMQDADSNFLVVGTTHSTDGDITFTHGNSELFVIKLNPSGNLIWMKQYGGTSYESGRYIMQMPDGNYLVTGYTASNNNDVPPGEGGHDGWLLKLDTAGTILWSKTYGGSGADRIRDVIVAPDGGLVFTGSTTSNDVECLGNNGGTDFWVAKTDSVGNLLWSELFGGSDEDYAYHITSTSDGAYLVTGYTESTDGDIINNYGEADGWLIKVDDQGQLLNQKNFGGSLTDRLYKSYEISPGQILTAGFAQSSDYDLSGINSGPSKSYWLMQMDASLNINWSYATGGSAADLGKELIFDSVDSSVVIMGESNSINGSVLGNHGDFDFWLVKLELFTALPKGIDNENISVNYIPSSQNLVVHATRDFKADILINDMTGKKMEHLKNVRLQKGENYFKLNFMKDASEGFYTVSVLGEKIQLVSKFLNLNR